MTGQAPCGYCSISLSKTVSTDGMCHSPGSNMISVSPGTDVTYCYKMTNNSPITLTMHDLQDSVLGSIFSNLSQDVGPGAMFSVTATLPNVTAMVMNVATWESWISPEVTAVVSATDQAKVLIGTPPATPTPTVTPTSTITPTPPNGPMITGGTTSGSSTVTGNSDPSCTGGKVLIFDCGYPPDCHHCTGPTVNNTPCPDTLLGMGSKDQNGNFIIPLSFSPAPGHEIYATDGCKDPGIVGPDVVIQAPATAPLLSAQGIAMLIAALSIVGFVGLSRLRRDG